LEVCGKQAGHEVEHRRILKSQQEALFMNYEVHEGKNLIYFFVIFVPFVVKIYLFRSTVLKAHAAT
jgi:hypothetical protein